ncbi:SUMF1/EgtB/PvdO family nonheme iron enzyme [Microbacterium sp. CIAB417]|uniref:formylglycine-generating enzyme family protein n=1 Tax=Microbacterium sp. CIAB417 TaxID=2860287 RepID=UPI0027E236A6|nr:SUMF1/EgtB/PvdO family nonheme iron enzyme [Microbacterium sp. CIAB417]
MGRPGQGQRPVASVSWLDAVRFCNAASERDRLSPVYDIDGEEVGWRTSAWGYRLPTEAEWEYACRAGTTTPQYASLDVAAWTSQDGVDSPQPVRLKAANPFGLYDMLGNVWEWCWDYLDPARYGAYRVFRGGGFDDEAWSARASTRRGGAPDMNHPDLGFRVAFGGIASSDPAQGWSAAADTERSAISGAMPPGWTPRRL